MKKLDEISLLCAVDQNIGTDMLEAELKPLIDKGLVVPGTVYSLSSKGNAALNRYLSFSQTLPRHRTPQGAD